jgi:hypothetical protein
LPPPLFQDVFANKQTANSTKKVKKKGHTAPEMCFQLDRARSVQTVHGANDGKYMNTTKPGIDLGLATQASTAEPSNANQLVIKIASSEDDTSSSEGSEEVSNSTSSSDNLSLLSSSEEEEQSKTPVGRR